MTRSNLILLALVVCIARCRWSAASYALRLGTIACMYGMLALSWNFVGGLAGYPSFATAAFFGFGAYTAGVLLAKACRCGCRLPRRGVLSFALACLLGAALLRLRGHYFAIASLSLVEVFRELVNNATDLTGGGMGLNIPLTSRPASWRMRRSFSTRCGDCWLAPR